MIILTSKNDYTNKQESNSSNFQRNLFLGALPSIVFFVCYTSSTKNELMLKYLRNKCYGCSKILQNFENTSNTAPQHVII